jgi:uncharacterized protein YndB with AHSA1/START domain
MSSITLVRRIKARPSIVFDALTTADGIAAWWGPDELPVVRAEVDARVGGAYRVRFRSIDGGEHEAHGTFLEFVAPRRIVMTYQYTLGGEADELGRTSRIEFELVRFAGGTDLTFTHTALATEVSARSHTSGWSGALNKLVRNMERARATADLEHGEQR